MTIDKQQTIFRGAHGELPYFMMLRTTAQDATLSFEARGLIAYLLSKPNDWEINKADLMREGGLGRTKMKRIMDELTTAGYMTISQERDENERFLIVVYTLHEEPQAQNVPTEQGGAGSTKPAERKTRRAENDPQHNTESLQSTEENISTGAKSAPDADAAAAMNKSMDDMLAELDITQADIDAAPLDELIDEPVDDVDLRALHDASEWHEDLATVDDPDPVPDDFKAIQEYTVVTVFKGNKAMYGKAGDIANWALCRNEKSQWVEWKPDRPFTIYEWITFLAWYAVKDIAWPSSGEKWNKQAFEWRDCDDYRQLMRAPVEQPSTTTSHATREALGLVGGGE